MTMAILEIKGYLQAYREMICFLLSGFLVASILFLGVNMLVERGGLFEPFTVGVVDHDGTPELIFVFDFFNENIINLEFMEKDEALAKLEAGEIPAFVELPENFTRDVFHGINSPFTVHQSSALPLQGMLVQLLASSGIAFLSASQAGVYATLGYVYEAGVTWEQVQQELLIPVNMAFAQQLIRHSDIFEVEVLSMVAGGREGVSPSDYFLRRFAAFWHMISLLALQKYLIWYPPGIIARFKLAGIKNFEIYIIKWIGLFAATGIMALPLIPIVGIIAWVVSTLFTASFGLLLGKLVKGSGARGLMIFSVALIMYFASGGIVPFVFLPMELLPMRYFSVIYWVAIL